MQVRETATPDMGRMGVEIVSFVIQRIDDEVDYLSSIGKAQTAAVVKEAVIGITHAVKDAKIVEAKCKERVNGVRMACDAMVDDARKTYETERARCNTQIFRAQ